MKQLTIAAASAGGAIRAARRAGAAGDGESIDPRNGQTSRNERNTATAPTSLLARIAPAIGRRRRLPDLGWSRSVAARIRRGVNRESALAIDADRNQSLGALKFRMIDKCRLRGQPRLHCGTSPPAAASRNDDAKPIRLGGFQTFRRWPPMLCAVPGSGASSQLAVHQIGNAELSQELICGPHRRTC